MRRSVKDVKDARTIERAKRANAGKPRISWAQAKKDADLISLFDLLSGGTLVWISEK
jgi:hypothetical protein